MGVHVHTHIFLVHPHLFSAFSFTSNLCCCRTAEDSRALVLLFQAQSSTKLHLNPEFVAKTVFRICFRI